jgi:uncharacterized membrane protein YccC
VRWRGSRRLRLPEDPDLAALRKAVRVAVVVPPAFAASLLLVRDPQFVTFVPFGCFSLLVLADFGGRRPPRAVAYAATTAVGAVLVVLGTLASASPWTAAAVTLLLAFAIRLAGMFGGYALAAQGALLLAFVIAVTLPAPPAAIPPRVAGWLTAGVLSGLAGVLLWPRFERPALMSRAADACHALAELVASTRRRGAGDESRERRRAAAEAAVGAARAAYRSTPKRPAAPARRDRAFAELLTELASLLEFTLRPFGTAGPSSALPAGHPCLGEGDRLAAAAVRALDASGDVLTGGAAPDLVALQAARLAHRRALDRWAATALRSGTPPDTVLAGLGADDGLSAVSFLALALASNAVVATGGRLPAEVSPPAGTPRHTGPTGVGIRIARSLRAHLDPTSTVLHDAVRLAVGLALAVLAGRLLRLDHAFWVVLGTLSVLRSSAVATGRTTLQALAGTLAGIVVGALFAQLAGASAVVAWALLPVAAFAATYASTAVGFVVGQAAFTVLVIVLFTLISPVGWRLGLIRIEDVAVGAGISVVTALLLWPRGVRRDLGTALAGLFRSTGLFLGASLDHVLERAPRDRVSRSRAAAVRARDRAGEVLEQLMAERAARVLDPEQAAFLVASGKHLIRFGDTIELLADTGYRAPARMDRTEALHAQVGILTAEIGHLGDRLDGRDGRPGAGAPGRVSGTALDDIALTSLGRWRDDPAVERSAVAVVAATEWVQLLDAFAARLEAPVSAAAAAASSPWWRWRAG